MFSRFLEKVVRVEAAQSLVHFPPTLFLSFLVEVHPVHCRLLVMGSDWNHSFRRKNALRITSVVALQERWGRRVGWQVDLRTLVLRENTYLTN